MDISSIESYLALIAFANPHQIIGSPEIQIDENVCPFDPNKLFMIRGKKYLLETVKDEHTFLRFQVPMANVMAFSRDCGAG